jgi:nicotinamidase-related amidase
MDNTAILIIDMQVGAAQMVSPPFYRMDEIISRLCKVIANANLKGVPVFYAQHYNPTGFPAYGSEEWQLIPELAPQDADTIIHKTTPDAFLNTDLHERLQERKIERLIIAGIQTADCVDTTCRRAFSLGYKVTLIKDGHTTFDTQHLKAEQIIAHHNQIIENWFGEVLAAEEIKY